MPSATTDGTHANEAMNGHNEAPTSGLDLIVFGLNSGTSMVSRPGALLECLSLTEIQDGINYALYRFQ
jgi:hypothetical protein